MPDGQLLTEKLRKAVAILMKKSKRKKTFKVRGNPVKEN